MMSLQETIRRIIREDDYSPAGKEITPNKVVIHKSNPVWRENILKTGLQASAGECYKTYVGYGVKCKPAIFATNSTNKRAWFDSTYDDDIWEINTEMIPDVKWYKDRHFESRSKHIVTFQDIPSDALTLKYKGNSKDGGIMESKEQFERPDPPKRNINESIRKVLREETNPKKEGLLNIIKERGLYYITKYTGLNYDDIYHKIGELPREVKIRYLKDVVNDLQQMPSQLDLTFLTGRPLPVYENDERQVVYAAFISNRKGLLKVHTFIYDQYDESDEYNVISEDDLDYETLEALVTNICDILQHQRM